MTMLSNETVRKLHEMRLGVMAEAFSAQLEDAQFHAVSFEDRFAMLVDAEWSARKSNRLTRLIRNAGYADPAACVENIEYHPERRLDREQILRLASCTYLQEAHNVIILGATGAGKTYLACALGMAASRSFYSVRYIRLPDLLVEISVARANGTYRDYMKKRRKEKLLILDEWLLYPLKEAETRDVLELVEARNKVASTIFCSQYDTSEWHENLYDPTLADLLQNHPVKVFHNQLLHVLVECDCCLLVVAVADLEGKPHIIDKGREAVSPLLWRKGVRLSLLLLLLIFFP